MNKNDTKQHDSRQILKLNPKVFKCLNKSIVVFLNTAHQDLCLLTLKTKRSFKLYQNSKACSYTH